MQYCVKQCNIASNNKMRQKMQYIAHLAMQYYAKQCIIATEVE